MSYAERIETFTREFNSMAARAQKRSGRWGMAHVIFESNYDGIYVQAAIVGEGCILIDLPIYIMNDERVEVLRQIFEQVHESYEARLFSRKKLISYQIFFRDADVQKNITMATEAVEDIFLKVFGLPNNYSIKEIKTEQG
jgi:hypothetical protein